MRDSCETRWGYLPPRMVKAWSGDRFVRVPALSILRRAQGSVIEGSLMESGALQNAAPWFWIGFRDATCCSRSEESNLLVRGLRSDKVFVYFT